MTPRTLESMVARLGRTAQGCAVRGLVHAGSLLFVILTALTTDTLHSPGAWLALYTGLVCLFGRFLFQPFGGVVPLAAGLIQALLAAALGLDLAAVIFLGGLQAWIQSVGVGKSLLLAGEDNRLDLRDLLAGGVLGLCGILLLASGNPGAGALLTPLVPGTLAGFALWPGALVWARRASRAAARTVATLLTESRRLPSVLETPASRLVELSGRFLAPGVLRAPRQVFPFAHVLLPLERKLLAVSWNTDPAARLREAERLFTELKTRNADLARTAPGDPAPRQNPGRGTVVFNDIDYRLKIANLEAFLDRLPPALAGRVNAICRASENIMDAMRDDAQRVPEGERFLTRYLDATTGLVQQWCRLPGSGAAAENEATTRLLALLDRLEEAFASEHARLLESGRLDYTADLNTLDRLLDMEGARP